MSFSVQGKLKKPSSQSSSCLTRQTVRRRRVVEWKLRCEWKYVDSEHFTFSALKLYLTLFWIILWGEEQKSSSGHLEVQTCHAVITGVNQAFSFKFYLFICCLLHVLVGFCRNVPFKPPSVSDISLKKNPLNVDLAFFRSLMVIFKIMAVIMFHVWTS